MSKEVRTEVARAGGLAVAQDNEHMRKIGKKGGLAISKDRQHMRKIGRLGGSAPRVAQESKE